MLNDVVEYMVAEGIEINPTNYKLELLNFLAAHTVNDLDNSVYIDEMVRVHCEEMFVSH